MGKTKETILPSIDDQHELANRFGGFFLGKIENIRNDLSSTCGSSPNDSDIFGLSTCVGMGSSSHDFTGAFVKIF
jgi:hypothetical protein